MHSASLVGIGRLNPKRGAGSTHSCTAYVAVIRGTPLLVQLFILFFGLPHFGILLPAVLCGVLGLGVYSGAYVSEIVRGAIQSVAPGPDAGGAVARHDALRSRCARSSCRRRWCA